MKKTVGKNVSFKNNKQRKEEEEEDDDEDEEDEDEGKYCLFIITLHRSRLILIEVVQLRHYCFSRR